VHSIFESIGPLNQHWDLVLESNYNHNVCIQNWSCTIQKIIRNVHKQLFKMFFKILPKENSEISLSTMIFFLNEVNLQSCKA
jgi:hypothetical protein